MNRGSATRLRKNHKHDTIFDMGVIVKDPDILGGTPVFRGTRVPIQTLFDYLEGGDTLEDFLKGFPTPARPPSQPLKKLNTSYSPALKCAF